MKSAKRPAKKKDLSKTKTRRPAGKQLTEEQLERVAGGVDGGTGFFSKHKES